MSSIHTTKTLPKNVIEYRYPDAAPSRFLCAQRFLFRGQQGGVHGWSIGRLAELIEDGGLLGHQANSGQGVQMQPVVLATYQEEQVRRLAVGRAKKDLL